MSRDAIDLLRAIPIFSQLDAQALEQIASIASRLDAAKGSVLIERGQPGSGMFVILQATVVVELRERTVELGAGEFIRRVEPAHRSRPAQRPGQGDDGRQLPGHRSG